MRKTTVVLMAFMLSTMSACSSPTDSAPSALTAELTAQSTNLRIGDSTALRLVVRNATRMPLSFEIGVIPFDFAIEQAGRGELWRFSHQPTTGPARRLTIPARDSMVLPATLRVGVPAGVNLPEGAYQLRGFLVAVGGEVIAAATPVLELTIRP